MTGSLRRRFSTAIVGRVNGAIFQTVIIALLARRLGVAGFAEFAVVVGTAQAIASATDLGFGLRVLQLAAEPQKRRVIGALLVARLLTIGIVLVAATTRASTQQEGFGLVFLFSYYAVGEVLGDLALAIWQGEMRSGMAAGGLVARRLATLAPLALLPSESASSVSLLVAGTFGLVLLAVVGLRRAGKPLGLRAVLRQNGPLTLLTSAFGIQTTDSAIVGLSGSSVLTASYGAASRLANPINLAISTLTQVLIPTFRSLPQRDRLAALRRARRPILLIAALTACLSVCSPIVVNVLYGEAFMRAVPIVTAVFVGAAISAIAQLHLSYLISGSISVRFGVTILIGVVTGLGIIGVLAAAGGVYGAAAGFVLNQVVILLVVMREFLNHARAAQ